MASVLEPFGAVTNEALLAGCWSLIFSKAGSQCLIENGKNGYTFDPMNIDELYSKMSESSKKLLRKKATMNNVKENLMLTHYDELMQNLILHIRN